MRTAAQHVRRKVARSAAALLLGACGILPAAAGVTAVDHGLVGNTGTLDRTFGYAFELTRTVTLTHLGRYDFGDADFAQSATAGIWDAAQQLRVSAAIPFGANAGGFQEADSPANGVFFRPVAATTLTPGAYTIGIQGGTEPWSYDSAAVFAPGLIWKEGRQNESATFAYPATVRAQPSCWFGPNFKFAEGAAIAIASYAYDGAGAGALPSTSPAWPDTATNELRDGLFPASLSYGDAAWVGFYEPAPDDATCHPQVTVDLGSVQALAEAAITYLHSDAQALGSITAPEEARVSVSTNGADFTPPESFTREFDSSAGEAMRTAFLNLDGLTGRYVRLDFRNTSPWTFLAEITFTRSVGDRHAWWAHEAGTTNSGAYALGFRFTVSQPIEITALGRVDRDRAGFSPALARVFNWDTGAPLATATITNDLMVETNGALEVHYAALAAPCRLQSGTTYLVAVDASGNSFAYGHSATFGEAVTWLDGRATMAAQPMPATASAATFPLAYTAGLAYMGPNFIYRMPLEPVPELTLTHPTSRQVVQRDAADGAAVRVEGAYRGTCDRVEARATPVAGYHGTATGWTVVDANPDGRSFAGTLRLLRGWYELHVRGVFGATLVTATVDRVGVGEVFVTAGQSNSANHGSPAQSATDDRVSARTSLAADTWQHAQDPQPLASGGGGSPWPTFGDTLASALDVPVGFIAVGIGATYVAQWVPGTNYYDERLSVAIRSFGADGFRAVLWHQGESDSYGTPTATYVTQLQAIIAQSRVDAGFAVPWGVALASWNPSATAPNMARVIAGQQQVIAADPLVFQGPETDTFHLTGYTYDNVHFNAAGLTEHGRLWAHIVQTFFFPHPKGTLLRLAGETRGTP